MPDQSSPRANMDSQMKCPETSGDMSPKQSRIGIATLRFQNRKYQFPSIIVRNNGKQQCIMLDVCLLCPFCTGDINARIIPLESRVLLAQGQSRHSYPPAGPDVVLQCEDLATSFAQQFPHLLSPSSRHHLTHCNVENRISQSADETMMNRYPPTTTQPPDSDSRLLDSTTETQGEHAQLEDNKEQSRAPPSVSEPQQISDALDPIDSDANAEGDSTQTSDTDSVESVRCAGSNYSTVKRAFPHDVIRAVIDDSTKPEVTKSQETIKRSPKPPISPKCSPKQKKRSPKPPTSHDNRDNSAVMETTTAVVVKSTIHQTVAELLDLPSESDSEDTGTDKDKPSEKHKVSSLDNIRSVSQLSDYGSMESMTTSRERLHRSRSEGMGSMDSSLHSAKKAPMQKTDLKAVIRDMKDLPESVKNDFVKLRSKTKRINPESAWSYDDLRELYKGANVASGQPFRHSQGDRIATVYPIFDFRREAPSRNGQSPNTRPQPTGSLQSVTAPGTAPHNTAINHNQQLDVNANLNSTMNMNVSNSQQQQEVSLTQTDNRDPEERGIEDAEREMERVVGEMTSLEAELEQMYRMTARSRQQRPPEDGAAANLGDSSTTLASLQERHRIEQEEIERMQELEDERRRPFIADAKKDRKASMKKDKEQSQKMPNKEAQFEEEERRVQLWLREQQKRQKILQKQNLTQQDRRRLQILNEQRRQQFLQERLRHQLEAHSQQMQLPETSTPSAMSQEDVKRRQKIKDKLQRQAEQLHQLQMQALYQQRPRNERQAEIQWQAIQEHQRRVLQEQAELSQSLEPPPKKEKPPVPPKPTFGVPRVGNLTRKDETPPEIRRMRNVMSFLESSSQEALQDTQQTTIIKPQASHQESSTSSSAPESYSYQHLYEEEAMASLENEDLNFYDEENDRVIDRTGNAAKLAETECLIQDPEDVYAQHIRAKDISQMLDILERVVDGSRRAREERHSVSSSSDDEEIEIKEKDPEETVDEILENIDTDNYSPNATLSRAFTTPRRKRGQVRNKDLEASETIVESEDQLPEMTLDEVLESMECMVDTDSSQLFDSVIKTEVAPEQNNDTEKRVEIQRKDEISEGPAMPEEAQLTVGDLISPQQDDKRSSSTECLPDDNTSLEIERSICYSENTSETTSYDEDSIDLQVAEAKMSQESTAEIKNMIEKTSEMTNEIMQDGHSSVRLQMLSPIIEERSVRSSAISTESSQATVDDRSPRSSQVLMPPVSNRSSAASSELMTETSSEKRSSRSTDIDISQSVSISPVSSNRSSQGIMFTAESYESSETPIWAQESFESQVPLEKSGVGFCDKTSKSTESVEKLIDESMLIEQVSRSASASPRDHILYTSSESESGASLQRRQWNRNQNQLSPYAYEYEEAVSREMTEPVNIRLYPSTENVMAPSLPPEQANMQLTVVTDNLSLDDFFQEGKPAISLRSPQLFSPTKDEDPQPINCPETTNEEVVKITTCMKMAVNAGCTESSKPLSEDEVKEDQSSDKIKPLNTFTIEPEGVSAKEQALYTMQEKDLDIIEITTEINKKPIQPDVIANVNDAKHLKTERVSDIMDVEEGAPSKEEYDTEPQEAVEKLTTETEPLSHAVQIPEAHIVQLSLSRTYSSSSESLDVSSEEDEITNVMDLLHKVKEEYEPDVHKYQGSASTDKEAADEKNNEEDQLCDTDSGSEVVIDDAGNGEVYKIKLDRQSSLHFQRLSRENSLRDEFDDISEEYAFNMHVRSLEKLTSLSREALNMSNENIKADKTSKIDDTEEEPVEVMKREIEAISRLESLITVESEPETQEETSNSPGFEKTFIEDDFEIPLEMSCSMESIEEEDEQMDQQESEDEKQEEMKPALSQGSQLDIIIEEDDYGSHDSKTSSPSKKSVEIAEDDSIEYEEESSPGDNESAETSSSFALSESSGHSGQPDLLHNVIVCAGAKMTRGSDSDSINIESDSSSDGFGSMRASTLKIRVSNDRPPVYPASKTKLTSPDDTILGENDDKDANEAGMAIFNFKQALAMFEGMKDSHESKSQETEDSKYKEQEFQSKSYVTAAIQSHQKFVEESIFGKRLTDEEKYQHIPQKASLTDEIQIHATDNEINQHELSLSPNETSSSCIVVSKAFEEENVFGEEVQHVAVNCEDKVTIENRGTSEVEIAIASLDSTNIADDEKVMSEYHPEKNKDDIDSTEDTIQEVIQSNDSTINGTSLVDEKTKENSKDSKQKMTLDITTTLEEKPKDSENFNDVEESTFKASREVVSTTEKIQGSDGETVQIAEFMIESETENKQEALEESKEKNNGALEQNESENHTQEEMVIESKHASGMIPEIIIESAIDDDQIESPSDDEAGTKSPLYSQTEQRKEEMLLDSTEFTNAIPELIPDSSMDDELEDQLLDSETAKKNATQEIAKESKGDTNEIPVVDTKYSKETTMEETTLNSNDNSIVIMEEKVREISPIVLATCEGEEVVMDLKQAENASIISSHAHQLECPDDEDVQVMKAPSPAEPDLQFHGLDERDLSTVQEVFQEQSLVFESGELVNADSCAELSSRDSETSDVTVITMSACLDSRDDLTQEPTMVEELASPSPDNISFMSSSEDVSAKGVCTPVSKNILDNSYSSQEASFVLETQERLSIDDVNSLSAVTTDFEEEANIAVHSLKSEVVDFERSLSSQEASFVLERDEIASDNDVRDMTPVPDDSNDLTAEVLTPDYGCRVSENSTPTIMVADFDPVSKSEEEEKRSTIDSQKSAVSLIQAVIKSSDTDEVVTVSPDVTQISLLEQQAEYQRYKDELSSSITDQSSSSNRSSVHSTQEKFESYMNVNQQEVELEVPRVTVNTQQGQLLMQPGMQESQEELPEIKESDSFDDLHRSPSFQRHKPRRSPSTSSSEKASLTYSQERSFEKTFESGQPVTEWHASRTATYESNGNVLYHEESQISSDTEGSLRRKRKVLIKRPSADSNEFETRTFVKEDVTPSPVLKKACNVIAVRSDSVSEGEEGDDEEASSSGTISREGSSIRYSSAEDVNDILEKVRAVVLEARKYKEKEDSQTDTCDNSNDDAPDDTYCEAEDVGATSQEIKDYLIHREDEDLKQKEAETEEFLRHLLQRHHQDHVTKEASKDRNSVTDISACLEEVCRALSESDSDEIVVDEDVQTQEVTLVFAWPKSMKPVFQYHDKPYREIFMRRITRIRDFDLDFTEGPELASISVSGSQSDESKASNDIGKCQEQSPSHQGSGASTVQDIQNTETEGENNKRCMEIKIEHLITCPSQDSNSVAAEKDCMLFSNKNICLGCSLDKPSCECTNANLSSELSSVNCEVNVQKYVCLEGSGNCGENETKESKQSGNSQCAMKESEVSCKQELETPEMLQINTADESECCVDSGSHLKGTDGDETKYEDTYEEAAQKYAQQFCENVIASALVVIKAIYNQVDQRIAECRSDQQRRKFLPVIDFGVPNSPVPIRRNTSNLQVDQGANAGVKLNDENEQLQVRREILMEEKWTTPMKLMQKTSLVEIITEKIQNEVTKVEAPCLIDSNNLSCEEDRCQMSQTMHDSGIECYESREQMLGSAEETLKEEKLGQDEGKGWNIDICRSGDQVLDAVTEKTDGQNSDFAQCKAIPNAEVNPSSQNTVVNTSDCKLGEKNETMHHGEGSNKDFKARNNETPKLEHSFDPNCLSNEDDQLVASISQKARGMKVCIDTMLGAVLQSTKEEYIQDIHNKSSFEAFGHKEDNRSDSEGSVNSLLDKLEVRYPSQVVHDVFVAAHDDESNYDIRKHDNMNCHTTEIIREYKERVTPEDDRKSEEVTIYPTEIKRIQILFEPENPEVTKQKLVRHSVSSVEQLLYPDLMQPQNDDFSDVLTSMLGCSMPELICSNIESKPDTKSSSEVSLHATDESKIKESQGPDPKDSEVKKEIFDSGYGSLFQTNPECLTQNMEEETDSTEGMKLVEAGTILERDLWDKNLESVIVEATTQSKITISAVESDFPSENQASDIPLSTLENDFSLKNQDSDISKITRESEITLTPLEIDVSNLTEDSDISTETTVTQDSEFSSLTKSSEISSDVYSNSTSTTPECDNFLIDHYQVEAMKLKSLPEVGSSDGESDDTLTDATLAETALENKDENIISVVKVIDEPISPTLVDLSVTWLSENSDSYSTICDAALSGSDGTTSVESTTVEADLTSTSSSEIQNDEVKAVPDKGPLQSTASRQVQRKLDLSPSSKLIYIPLDRKQLFLRSINPETARTKTLMPSVEMEKGIYDDIWTPNTRRHAQALRGKELSELIQEQKTMFAKLQEMRTSFDELLHEVESVKLDISKDDEIYQGQSSSLFANIAKLRPLSGIDHRLADERSKDDGGEKQHEEVGQETKNQAPRMYQPRYRAIDEEVKDMPTMSSIYQLPGSGEKPMERSISSPVLSPESQRREVKFLDLAISSPCLSPDIVRKPKTPEIAENVSATKKMKIRVAMEKLNQPMKNPLQSGEDLSKRAEKVRWAEDYFRSNTDEYERKYSSSPQIGKVSFKDIGPAVYGYEDGIHSSKDSSRIKKVVGRESKLTAAIGVRRDLGPVGVKSRSLDSQGQGSGYQVDSFDADDDDCHGNDGACGDEKYREWRANRYSEMRHQRTKPSDLESRNKQFRSHLLARSNKGERNLTKSLGSFLKIFSKGSEQKK